MTPIKSQKKIGDMMKRVGTGAMTGWWEGLSKDERKAFMKAQLAFKMKKTQAQDELFGNQDGLFGRTPEDFWINAWDHGASSIELREASFFLKKC